MVWIIALIVALAAAEWRWPARPGAASDRRLFTNYALAAVSLALGTLVPIGAIAAAAFAAERGIGLLQGAALPLAAFVGLILVARSLATYWFHRACHALPWLWALHRLHHADREVDLSTALRNHPAEVVLALLVAGGVTLAIGPPLAAALVAEIILFAAALWGHANVRLHQAAGSRLEWLVVTPASHCRHHSAERAIADGNYGDSFTVWDRLFGTWHGSAAVERIGID
jgi:sterol desaturase/sphingolipid hydroxylase (fatty acid hydroxylase superfamily)